MNHRSIDRSKNEQRSIRLDVNEQISESKIMTKQNPNSYSYDDQYSNRYFQGNSEESHVDLPTMNDAEENDHVRLSLAYKKRLRTKFSQEQLDTLEMTFQQHHYPTVDIIDDLVERLDLPTQKITVWFQNRRARAKKSQPKTNESKSTSRKESKQYDSGIHLDDDVSHDSSSSPMTTYPTQTPFVLPPPPFGMSMTTNPMVPPGHFHPYASYYGAPDAQPMFYSSMWQNFNYPMSSPSFEVGPSESNSNVTENVGSFLFQDVSNYSYHREFDGNL